MAGNVCRYPLYPGGHAAPLMQARTMTIDATSRIQNSLPTQGLPVQGLPLNGAAAAAPGVAAGASRPAAASMPAVADGVSAEVRSLARDMAARPPVDGGKVAAIRTGIAAGTYRVDAELVADAMLAAR